MSELATSPEPGSIPAQDERVEAFHAALGTQGVRLRTADGRTKAASFGDTAGEHGAFLSTAGLVDQSDRLIVAVRGDRARQMLSGLLTNDLAPLERGRAVYSFVLTPKGRPLAEVRALGSGDGLWLDTPAACSGALLEHLGKYLPPIFARFEPLPGRTRISLVGPRSPAALRSAAGALGIAEPDSVFPGTLPEDALRVCPTTAGEDGPVIAVVREPIEGPGVDLILPTASLGSAWEALTTAVEAEGGQPAGDDAYRIFRVERGVPEYGMEMDLRNLPQETGQQGRAISYEKGCYTGQEVVARVHYRGHVNRTLRGLELSLEDDELPEGEAPLFDGAREVGQLSTVVRSPRLGPIALGYVRREIEPGAELSLSAGGPLTARLRQLPFTST